MVEAAQPDRRPTHYDKPKRVAVVGCRPPPINATRSQVLLFQQIVRDVRAFVMSLPVGTTVVSGGADGVDAVAARAHGHNSVIEHLPNYDLHGAKAPLVRNKIIAESCDEMHAWPAPWSKGTWHAIQCAKAIGKPVFEHHLSAERECLN